MSLTFTFKDLQQHQKDLAAKIKEAKGMRKSVPHGYVEDLDQDRETYRHYHIAYCLLRGRTIEQIEQPREGNEHNKAWVERIMKQVPPRKEEVVEEVARVAV